jgi:hypothetical protein
MSTVFTSSVNSKNVPGNRYMTQVTLTGPTSYSTGGVAYTAANFGFDFSADFVIIGTVSGGLIAVWDRANSKIKLFYPTGGASAPGSLSAPAAAAPALSGAPAIGTIAATVTPDAGATTMTGSAAKPTLNAVVSGAPAIGSLAAAAPALTAGIGKEVAASTDVSSITIECLAFGY